MSLTQGKLRKRYQLDGHSGWITCIQITNTMIITGSKVRNGNCAPAVLSTPASRTIVVKLSLFFA